MKDSFTSSAVSSGEDKKTVCKPLSSEARTVENVPGRVWKLMFSTSISMACRANHSRWEAGRSVVTFSASTPASSMI